MATPFKAGSEDVDIEAFKRAVSFMCDCGSSGVTVVGVLGESNRLLDSEREAIVKAAVEAAEASKTPVCVGTSHPGTRATADLSKMAQELGASAVMVTPSREAAPLPSDKMIEFFGRVGEAIDIPIVLQDHPASTQVHMSMDLVAQICRDVPNIAAVKMESLPSPPKLRSLRQLLVDSKKEDVALLVGLGALYGAFDADAGMDGFMTGFAFPEALQMMVNASASGDTDLLHSVYSRWLPLIVFEQQPGIAIRKEVYRLRGLLESGAVRHPGGQLAAGTADDLKDLLDRMSPPGLEITKPLTAAEVILFGSPRNTS